MKVYIVGVGVKVVVIVLLCRVGILILVGLEY